VIGGEKGSPPIMPWFALGDGAVAAFRQKPGGRGPIENETGFFCKGGFCVSRFIRGFRVVCQK
jgi:hypothetical protein